MVLFATIVDICVLFWNCCKGTTPLPLKVDTFQFGYPQDLLTMYLILLNKSQAFAQKLLKTNPT